MSAPIIIRQIYRKLFLQCFECCARSALQLNTSTTFDLSFITVLCECWCLSAPIIIRQIYRNFSYNVSNAVPGQHCRSTLAQHYVYRLKQFYTNVDGWARRSSFVKYIGNFSYNVSNVMPGQHYRSTLAQHYVYRLKLYYVNIDGWARRSSFVKYIGKFSYNVSNVVPGQHCSSTLAHHLIYRL